MPKVYYHSGAWTVTEDWVRTRYRDFRTASITAIQVSRFPLIASAAITGGVLGTLLTLSPIIYASEKVAAVILCVLGICATSQVGWIELTASDWRGTDTGRVWGPLWRLRALREGILAAQADIEPNQEVPS